MVESTPCWSSVEKVLAFFRSRANLNSSVHRAPPPLPAAPRGRPSHPHGHKSFRAPQVTIFPFIFYRSCLIFFHLFLVYVADVKNRIVAGAAMPQWEWSSVFTTRVPFSPSSTSCLNRPKRLSPALPISTFRQTIFVFSCPAPEFPILVVTGRGKWKNALQPFSFQVDNCKDLTPKDIGGRSDPFIVAEVRGAASPPPPKMSDVFKGVSSPHIFWF